MLQIYYVSSFNCIVLHSSKWTPKPAQTWFNWCKIMNESVEKGNALALTPLHIYLVPSCLNLTARVPSIVYRYIYLQGHWVQVMHLAEITTQYSSNSFSVYQRAKSRSMISRVWIPLKDRTFVSWPFQVACLVTWHQRIGQSSAVTNSVLGRNTTRLRFLRSH